MVKKITKFPRTAKALGKLYFRNYIRMLKGQEPLYDNDDYFRYCFQIKIDREQEILRTYRIMADNLFQMSQQAYILESEFRALLGFISDLAERIREIEEANMANWIMGVHVPLDQKKIPDIPELKECFFPKNATYSPGEVFISYLIALIRRDQILWIVQPEDIAEFQILLKDPDLQRPFPDNDLLKAIQWRNAELLPYASEKRVNDSLIALSDRSAIERICKEKGLPTDFKDNEIDDAFINPNHRLAGLFAETFRPTQVSLAEFLEQNPFVLNEFRRQLIPLIRNNYKPLYSFIVDRLEKRLPGFGAALKRSPEKPTIRKAKVLQAGGKLGNTYPSDASVTKKLGNAYLDYFRAEGVEQFSHFFAAMVKEPAVVLQVDPLPNDASVSPEGRLLFQKARCLAGKNTVLDKADNKALSKTGQFISTFKETLEGMDFPLPRIYAFRDAYDIIGKTYGVDTSYFKDLISDVEETIEEINRTLIELYAFIASLPVKTESYRKLKLERMRTIRENVRLISLADNERDKKLMQEFADALKKPFSDDARYALYSWDTFVLKVPNV